jgi:hypothetical protein
MLIPQVLTRLAELVGDARPKVRDTALQVLLECLQTHGPSFSPGLWQLIVKGVLFPVFDDIGQANEDEGNFPTVWLDGTCAPALTGVSKLFEQV